MEILSLVKLVEIETWFVVHGICPRYPLSITAPPTEGALSVCWAATTDNQSTATSCTATAAATMPSLHSVLGDITTTTSFIRGENTCVCSQRDQWENYGILLAMLVVVLLGGCLIALYFLTGREQRRKQTAADATTGQLLPLSNGPTLHASTSATGKIVPSSLHASQNETASLARSGNEAAPAPADNVAPAPPALQVDYGDAYEWDAILGNGKPLNPLDPSSLESTNPPAIFTPRLPASTSATGKIVPSSLHASQNETASLARSGNEAAPVPADDNVAPVPPALEVDYGDAYEWDAIFGNGNPLYPFDPLSLEPTKPSAVFTPRLFMRSFKPSSQHNRVTDG